MDDVTRAVHGLTLSNLVARPLKFMAQPSGENENRFDINVSLRFIFPLDG